MSIVSDALLLDDRDDRDDRDRDDRADRGERCDWRY
jgi:hypothetical protein